MHINNKKCLPILLIWTKSECWKLGDSILRREHRKSSDKNLNKYFTSDKNIIGKWTKSKIMMMKVKNISKLLSLIWSQMICCSLFFFAFSSLDTILMKQDIVCVYWQMYKCMRMYKYSLFHMWTLLVVFSCFFFSAKLSIKAKLWFCSCWLLKGKLFI